MASAPTASRSTLTGTPARQRSASAAARASAGLLLEDILRVVDRSPGVPDRGKLGGEDLFAVEQDVHAVAPDHGSPGVSAERRRERGLPGLEMWQLEVRWNARASGDDEQGEA